MITTYFRSSSYGELNSCEQSYYLKYVLGLPDGTNKKAEMGTIVHKVMECLAEAKLALQEGRDFFEDDVAGIVPVKPEMVMTDAFVDFLFEKSYRYYSERSTHEYADKKERATCLEWTYKPLRILRGQFDPRNLDIFASEFHFDFEIDEPWAEYSFELPSGEVINGKLAMKGTIDLVTRVGDGVYESIDWKTGQRIDWSSNKPWPHNIKTFKKLMTDPQLRIYHYALHHCVPDAKQFIPTIYFINNHGTRTKPVPGGIYTMAFEKEDIHDTKEMLRKQFERVKLITRPSLNKTWRCTTLCEFGKKAHKSGEINPRTGKPYTICEYISKRTREVGLKQTTREEIHAGHTIGKYKAPGT